MSDKRKRYSAGDPSDWEATILRRRFGIEAPGTVAGVAHAARSSQSKSTCTFCGLATDGARILFDGLHIVAICSDCTAATSDDEF